MFGLGGFSKVAHWLGKSFGFVSGAAQSGRPSLWWDGTAGGPLKFTTDTCVTGNVASSTTLSFDDLATGTNTGATMVVGTGASLAASGTGTIAATSVTGTVPVANGGTGRASTTAYAVQCGGTTATGGHQPIAALGALGQVLTSGGAGVLPTFQDASVAGGTAQFDVNVTPATTAGTATWEDLCVIALDAGKMASNGDKLKITASGVLAANANTKYVRMRI